MVDVVVFAALGWEARAALDALQGVETDGPRRWRGYLGDGGDVRVFQVGVGPERARMAANAVPDARFFVSAGCAGALASGLRAGDIVLADRLHVIDAAGAVVDDIALGTPRLSAWAEARGIAARVGGVVSSPVLLDERQAKLRAGRT